MARSGLGAFYKALVAVAVVGAGATAWAVLGQRSAAIAGATGPVAIPDADDPTKLMAAARGKVKGDSAAPIAILEFGDFQCPYCGTFATRIEPELEKEYFATGKVKFVFYDFPLTRTHENAFLAARAARCADDQQKFWDYHDTLYRAQARWAPMKDPSPQFVAFATDLSMDAGQFQACLDSDRHADVVSAGMELGKQMEVDRTPTVMITRGRGIGERVTPTLDDIRTVLDGMEVEGAGAEGDGARSR